MSSQSTDNQKRVAIVTGAAQGIGQGIAIRLAQDGLNVVLSDLPNKLDQLNTAASDIQISYPSSQTLVIPADVSSEDEVNALVSNTTKHFGRLDVMVANAGIFKHTSILDASVVDFQKIWSVNLIGAFLCFKAAANVMIEQKRDGRLIAASSVTAKKGLSNIAAYGSSKAAIRSLVQSAASELGIHGITVNGYAPGVIDTPMFRESQPAATGTDNTPTGDGLLSIAAIKRLGQPSDVANIVSFLASKESSYITGQTMSVDGGIWYD